MNKIMNILKRIAGTVALPLFMFLIMRLFSVASGKAYYGTWPMWRALIIDVSMMITTAYGIGIQFKSGRFDFSGGGIMLLASIVAGRTAMAHNNNQILFVILAMVICIVLSLIVALVYIYGRLPIIIATIGMALIYESITTLIYGGGGINLVANMDLKVFSMYPVVLIPLVLSIVIYGFYSRFTTVGKQAELLSHNQQSAVNIGINEKKNVLITFVYSGVLFGLSTMIYTSSGIHKGAFSSLVTVGSLFSNILPVFIGLMLVTICGDTIGIIIGSLTLSLMSYGLKAIFNAEMGSAISIIITGLFIFGINVFSARGKQWIFMIQNNLFKRFKKLEV